MVQTTIVAPPSLPSTPGMNTCEITIYASGSLGSATLTQTYSLGILTLTVTDGNAIPNTLATPYTSGWAKSDSFHLSLHRYF